MFIIETMEEAFFAGMGYGIAGILLLAIIIMTIANIVIDAKNKPCEKCGKPHKDCICEKVPTKRELMKEIKEFQKKQEIEKLKERLEILKKGDK